MEDGKKRTLKKLKKIKSEEKENHKKYKRIIIIFYGGCYSCCYTYNIPQNVLYISFVNTNKFFTDLSRLRIDFYSQSESKELYIR